MEFLKFYLKTGKHCSVKHLGSRDHQKIENVEFFSNAMSLIIVIYPVTLYNVLKTMTLHHIIFVSSLAQ